jgi:hypothetical protein
MNAAPAHLLPVTFHEHIASIPVDPAVAYPNGVGMWRTLPAARRPDVCISVPLMISTDPHIARTGRNDSRLINVPGRSDLYYDFFGMNRSNAHRYRKQRGGQQSTHIRSPFRALTPNRRLRSSACFNAQRVEAINKNTLQCLKEWPEVNVR